MKQLYLTSALAAGLCFAGQAQAQTEEARKGFYLSVDAGVASVSDTGLDYLDEGGTFGGTGAQDVLESEVKLKSAFNVGGTIGYDFGNVRADIEIDYSRNKIDALEVQRVNGAAVTLTPGDIADLCDYAEVDNCSGSGNRIEFDGGKLRQLSAIANVWYDIPLGSAVTPYLGGGIGISGFEVEGEGKARFAWQLGAGVGFELAPGVALTADYRYRQAKGSTFTDSEFPEYAMRVGKLKTSTFSAGLRFTF